MGIGQGLHMSADHVALAGVWFLRKSGLGRSYGLGRGLVPDKLEVDTKSDSCYGKIEWWEEIEGQDHNWVDLQC